MQEEQSENQIQDPLKEQGWKDKTIALEALGGKPFFGKEENKASDELIDRNSTEQKPPSDTKATGGPLASIAFWGIFLGLGLILMMVSFHFWSQSAKPSPTIASQYLHPLSEVLNFANGGDDSEALEFAMQAYWEGKHQSAIHYFNQYLQQQEDANARLYLGITQLLAGQNAPAQSNLKTVMGKTEGTRLSISRWYLALAELQAGREIEARLLLGLLVDDPTYGLQASELLAEMNSKP